MFAQLEVALQSVDYKNLLYTITFRDQLRELSVICQRIRVCSVSNEHGGASVMMAANHSQVCPFCPYAVVGSVSSSLEV